MHRLMVFLFPIMLLISMKAASQAGFRPKWDSIDKKLSFRVMPQKFYTQPLGYFCKKEVQLQHLTRLPVFIRLGTKDYVDDLEGKNRWTRVGTRRY